MSAAKFIIAGVAGVGIYTIHNMIQRSNPIGLKDGDQGVLNSRRYIDYKTRIASDHAYDTFAKYVHPDADKREAGSKLTEKLDKQFAEFESSQWVWDLIHTDNATFKTSEDEAMYRDLVLGLRLEGAHTTGETNIQLKKMKSRIIELQTEYEQNNTEAVGVVSLDSDEVEALSDFVKEYNVEINDQRLSLKGYGLYMKVMKYCDVESVRLNTYVGFWEPARANMNILAELQQLRTDTAVLLGFSNHCEKKLSVNDAATPERVLNFLEVFKDNVLKNLPKDINEVTSTLEISSDEFMKVHNMSYFMTKYMKHHVGIDSKHYREFFQLEPVLEVMTGIYEEFFDIEMKPVEFDAWHPDVKTFQITRNGEVLGTVHLDLYAREGKWSHPSNFPLVRRHEYLDGTKQAPTSCLVTSFDNDGEQVELFHSEVTTMFHEFGHSLHEILNQSKYASLGGTAIERDLVEVPSMFLEYLCWEPENLKKLSSHKEDGRSLTDDEISNLIRAKNDMASFSMSKQIGYAEFDQLFNSGAEPAENMHSFVYKAAGLTGPDVPQAARFIHLVGYDAQYYTYIYSQSYAAMLNQYMKKDGSLGNYREFLAHSSGANLHAMLGDNDPTTLIHELFD